MLIDTLTAKLTADASGFTPVMEKAGQQLRGFQTHGESANHGLTLVRRGFESLAIQATGVSGPVGRVSQGLLTLGAGSATVLGVTAGIGLIAGAIKLLNKPMEDAKDAAKKFGDELMNTLANASRGAAIALQLKKVGEQIDELRDKVAHPGFISRVRETLFNLISSDKAGTASAQDQINKYTEAIAALEREFSVLIAQMKDADRQIVESGTKVQHYGERWTQVASELSGFANRVSDVNVQLRTQNVPLAEQLRLVQGLDLAYAQMVARIGISTGAPAPQLAGGTTRPFPTLRGKPEFVTPPPGMLGPDALEPSNDAMEKQMKERGAEIGAAFIIAMAQGAKNASDFLKQVMLEIAQIAIVHIFKLALGIASPSRVGVEIGRNFSLGLASGVAGGGTAVGGASAGVAARMAGSARLGLDVSGMPPAGDPRQAARDQQWQWFLRESNLVAKTAGFQFA